MRPQSHGLLAGALGAGVYGMTGSWQCGVATVVLGVAPDVDHLLDWYNWFVRRRTHRVFYLLHAWEYLGLSLVVAALTSWAPLVMCAALGYASHIVSDYLVHDRNAASYFLMYRAWHGFRRNKIPPWDRHPKLPPVDTT